MALINEVTKIAIEPSIGVFVQIVFAFRGSLCAAMAVCESRFDNHENTGLNAKFSSYCSYLLLVQKENLMAQCEGRQQNQILIDCYVALPYCRPATALFKAMKILNIGALPVFTNLQYFLHHNIFLRGRKLKIYECKGKA